MASRMLIVTALSLTLSIVLHPVPSSGRSIPTDFGTIALSSAPDHVATTHPEPESPDQPVFLHVLIDVDFARIHASSPTIEGHPVAVWRGEIALPDGVEFISAHSNLGHPVTDLEVEAMENGIRIQQFCENMPTTGETVSVATIELRFRTIAPGTEVGFVSTGSAAPIWWERGALCDPGMPCGDYVPHRFVDVPSVLVGPDAIPTARRSFGGLKAAFVR